MEFIQATDDQEKDVFICVANIAYIKSNKNGSTIKFNSQLPDLTVKEDMEYFADCLHTFNEKNMFIL